MAKILEFGRIYESQEGKIILEGFNVECESSVDITEALVVECIKRLQTELENYRAISHKPILENA